MNEAQALFALLRQVVCGEELDMSVKDQISPDVMSALFRLATPHDLVHIVGQGLKKLEYDPENPTFQNCYLKTRQAIFRYARIAHDYEQICAVLEKAQLRYLPLKGSVLRDWYPEPWMRTSSDIDILVAESDLYRAAETLVQQLHFTQGAKGHHDISMVSPNKTHLELHFTVDNMDHSNQEQEVLLQVWKEATPMDGAQYGCKLSDEMFYFYHITHMAKHLQDAECGIRPFLDLWILNHRVPHNRGAREALLEKGGMLQFAQAAQSLSEVWFSNAAPSPLTQRLEAFVLQHGTDASKANYVALKQRKQGGRLRFLLNRIFPPFQTMSYYYPVLQKKPWLLPVCMVRRWCRLLFTSDAKRTVQTVKTNATLSAQEVSAAAELMQQLGLQK